MKKLLLVSLCFLFYSMQIFAQNRTIKGTVVAKEDGGPMPGVGVKVKGTTLGVVTGADGKYLISVPSSATTLVFTFIGYAPQEKPISATTLNVTLELSNKQLGEVVVTGALGVKQAAKELGYASTNIDSKKLVETSPTNFTNGLTAKAPGLVISTLDNGINPATRFTLRGNRHILGNNYALVILNGVPISPNDVNTINPDDIESVDILNGAGAAALYGSEASNGALSITTKKGSSTGAPSIQYSNSFLAESISYFPALQTRFGSYGGEGGPYVDPLTGFIIKQAPFENQSYGPEYDGSLQQLGIPAPDGTLQKYAYSTPNPDPRLAFFKTGYSDQNNISYATGDAANSFNLSANNLSKKGVAPSDTYTRSVVRFSAAKTYGIFKADFTASYSRSATSTYGAGFDGTALNGGRSLLSSILNSPSWAPLQNFQDINATFGDVNTFYNSYSVNPYWVIANSRFNSTSDSFNGSFTGTITPTKWFDASYRLAGNFGTGYQKYTRAQVDFSAYAHSDPTGGYGTEASSLLGSTKSTPGSLPGQVQTVSQYGDGSLSTGAGPQGYSRIQQDAYLNFHHSFFSDFKADLLLGSTIWQEYLQQQSNSSTSLLISGYYNVNGITGVPTTASVTQQIRQIAFFGALNLSYKDYAFISVTERNDIDSRLAFDRHSFFYPSVKGSFVFTQAIPALKDNKILSYGKLRASYAQVGDINLSPYSTTNTFNATGGFPYGAIGGLSLSTTLNNPLIKPEITKEIEFGADLGFFNDRISGSITYYDSRTIDQTLPITTSPSTGFTAATVNVGEVDNTGLETKIDLQVLTKAKNKVGLDLAGNFTIQNSNVVSLPNGLPSITLGGYTNAAISAVVGQPYATLLGTDVQRDPQGHVVVDGVTGNPILNQNLTNLGRTTPKYLIGLTQTVSYKFITLSVTSEFRTGNVIYNQGLLQATAAGSSALSASSGRQRFVFPNSVIQTSPGVYVPNTTLTTRDGDINFFDAGDYYSASSTYVTSGAFWKIREADLNFDISSLAKKSKIIKRASFALIGRNLFMFTPKSNNWTDPEFAGTDGNASGFSNNQLPPTRFFGATLNVTF